MSTPEERTEESHVDATNPKMATALTRERLEIIREFARLHRLNRQLLEACRDLCDTLTIVTANIWTTDLDKALRDESLSKARAAIAAAEEEVKT